MRILPHWYDSSRPDIRFETCGACNGSGVEVFGVTVYEHGCGFSHNSTDERPCPACNGEGVREYKVEPVAPSDFD